MASCIFSESFNFFQFCLSLKQKILRLWVRIDQKSNERTSRRILRPIFHWTAFAFLAMFFIAAAAAWYIREQERIQIGSETSMGGNGPSRGGKCDIIALDTFAREQSVPPTIGPKLLYYCSGLWTHLQGSRLYHHQLAQNWFSEQANFKGEKLRTLFELI